MADPLVVPRGSRPDPRGLQAGASVCLVVDLVGHRSGVEPVRLPTLVDRAGTFASGGAPTLANVLVRSAERRPGYPLGGRSDAPEFRDVTAVAGGGYTGYAITR